MLGSGGWIEQIEQKGCPRDCARCPEDRAMSPRLGRTSAELGWKHPICGGRPEGSQNVPEAPGASPGQPQAKRKGCLDLPT